MTMERDADYFLSTEARIVAEDDQHVAIVVRLKKETLARNLSLFAALADRAPRSTVVPA